MIKSFGCYHSECSNVYVCVCVRYCFLFLFSVKYFKQLNYHLPNGELSYSCAHFQLTDGLENFGFVTCQSYEFKWNSEFETKDISKERIEKFVSSSTFQFDLYVMKPKCTKQSAT